MKKYLPLFLIIAIAGVVCSAFVSPRSDGYEVGDKAIDFSLKNIDGDMQYVPLCQDV